MRKVNTTIKYIEPYSIAEDAGIEVGDKLISINGHDFHDILEYRYLTAEYEVTLEILKKVAKYLKKKLTKENLLHDGKCDENQYRYYVSDDISSFEELGGIFLEREINGQVNKIDIEKYW